MDLRRPSLALLAFGMLAAPVNAERTLLWSDDADAYRSYREGAARDFPVRADPAAKIDRLDGEALVDALRTFTGARDPALANRGSDAGRAAARVFLRKEFEAMGYRVTEQPYRHLLWHGANLIAEREGKSGKTLIVSAHYDSVGNPGADDDGTGVIAMLGAARVLKDIPLKHGVRFVAFDQEERGLYGSAEYAKDLVARGAKTAILGDFHLEMMGYNARRDGKFHVISCGRADSEFMLQAFVQTLRNMGSDLRITSACTKQSDHSSFWKRGMPAIVVSENFFGGDANPCYHQRCDDLAHMHPDYFVKIAEAAANTIRLLVAERAPSY